MSTTYQFPPEGPPQFQVSVASNGAIVVRPNDCLSKYSMAIHGRGDRIHEYGRNRNGRIVPIENTSQIRRGETIFHLPTLQRSQSQRSTQRTVMDFSSGPDFIVSKPRELSTAEAKRQIEDYLVNDLRWSRYKANMLTAAIWSMKLSGKAIQVMAWNTLQFVGWNSLLHGAAMMAAPLFTLAGCVKGLCIVANTKNNYTRALAFCHGSTAFMFGDACPSQFPNELKDQYQYTTDVEWPAIIENWRMGAQAGYNKARMDAHSACINGKQLGVEGYRALMRFAGENKPEKLCQIISEKVIAQLGGRPAVGEAVRRLIKNGFGYRGFETATLVAAQ